ncbi:MAG: nucleoside deaminase [Muribaculaceae bacterium]|nr:nucleoside deaminase [Muribaculaceae bacterium]MDE6628219.1 nucleoside deaminase [Muribaculaceae bacterium]
MNYPATQADMRFMEMAAKIAEENIDNGGGPFGAVIVNEKGEVVATGANRVTADNDPTAHAEVNAIREACRRLDTFSLKGCTVYSSCEPCPMCLSALYWAGVSRIFFGNTQQDADRINFSDEFIYRELEKPRVQRAIPCIHIENRFTIKAFEKWAAKEDKIAY